MSNTCSVKVLVRVRPPSSAEINGGAAFKSTLSVRDDGDGSCGGDVTVVNTNECFAFDAVAGEDSTQEKIFSSVGRDVVDNLLDGYSCCIFAYGQTGAGKTYTMQGSSTDAEDEGRGLIPRVLEYLFSKIEESKTAAANAKESAIAANLAASAASADVEMQEAGSDGMDVDDDSEVEKDEDGAQFTYDNVDYKIRCSYVEIYNETVSDLLNSDYHDTTGFKKTLTIREDGKRGVFVDGVTEESVVDAAGTYKVFMNGSQNRAVGSTAMNRESSRSHSVFTISVESRRSTVNLKSGSSGNGGGDKVVSKRLSTLHLVDLAGSERQKHSEATGQTLKEATSINKSLSALGNVIKALVDIQSGRDVTRCHIPYRDSKLTFLLKDALGGNSRCAMIANVSPTFKCADETLSTLMFAQRVKLVTNKVTRNEEALGSVAAMQEMIRQLNAKVEKLTANGGKGGEEMAARVAELEGLLKESLYRANYAEETVAAQLNAANAKAKSLQELTDKLERALQSQKMIVRLRDGTIKRLQEKPGNDGGKENNLAHHNGADASEMKEELDILRGQVDCHPDAVKYRMEIESLQREMGTVERRLGERDATAFNSSIARQLAEVLQLKNDLSRQLDVARHGVIALEQEKERVEARAADVAAAFQAQTSLQEELMCHLSSTSNERDCIREQLDGAEAAIAKYVVDLAITSSVKAATEEELEQTARNAQEMRTNLEAQLLDAAGRYANLDLVRVQLKNETLSMAIDLAQLANRFHVVSKEKEVLTGSLEDLQREMSMLREQHASTIEQMNSTFCEQENELRRHASAVEARLVAEKNNIAVDAAAKIGALKDDINAQVERHAEELSRLKEEYETSMAALEDRLTAEARERQAEALSSAAREHDRCVTELAAAHEAAISDLTKSHESALDSERKNALSELDRVRSELESAADQAKESWECEKQDMHSSYEAKIEASVCEHEAKLAETQAAHRAEVIAAGEAHERRVAEIEQVHFSEMAALSEKTTKEREEMEAAHTGALGELKAGTQRAMHEKEREHAASLEKLEKLAEERGNDAKELGNRLECVTNDMVKLQAEHDAKVADLKETHDSLVGDLQMKMDAARATSEAAQQELQARVDAALSSAAALQEAVDGLQQSLEEKVENMKAMDERHRAEREVLNDAHAVETEKIVAKHAESMSDAAAECAKIQSAMEDAEARHADELRGKDTLIKSMTDEGATAAATIVELQSAMEDAEARHADELHGKDTLIKSMTDEGATAAATIAELQETSEKFVAERDEMHRAQEEKIQQLCEEHSRAMDALNAQLDSSLHTDGDQAKMDEEIGLIRSQNHELQLQLDAAIEERNAAVDTASATTSSLNAAEHDRESLQKEVAALRDQLRLIESASNSKLADVRSEADKDKAHADGEILALRSHLKSQESDLSGASSECEQLRAKLVDAAEKVKNAEQLAADLGRTIEGQEAEIARLSAALSAGSTPESSDGGTKATKKASLGRTSSIKSADGILCDDDTHAHAANVSADADAAAKNAKNVDIEPAKNVSKKRARRPLGEVQANEVDARPKKAPTKKKAPVGTASAAGLTDAKAVEKPTTRYSLRSRSTSQSIRA